MSENKRISRHIKNLFLDPNNYRFIDKDEHQQIPDHKLTDKRIQQRTMNFIRGHHNAEISDLIASFKANGFLDVDVIQVRDLGDNNYLVLEGNRRVTALKHLQELDENGHDIGHLSPEIFKKVPFEIHDNEDSEKHLIIMGLKHISGNKKWGIYNQDKLIYDFLSPYLDGDKNVFLEKENELMQSLGITKQRLRSRFRVFNLMLAYKGSDYGDQFNTNKYSFFDEIMRKPVIKRWFDWNDSTYQAENKIHLRRLFAWISKTDEFNLDEPELIEADEEEQDYSSQEREPIISKAREIRDLALFIHEERALETMERTGSVAHGLIDSGAEDQNNYQAALDKLNKNVTEIGRYADLVRNDDIEQLSLLINQLKMVLPQESRINVEAGNYQTAFEFGSVKPFSEIHIEQYKGIKNFTLNKLSRINILAGLNNCGKTTVLEAVYLLTRQNDISSLLKLFELKNKTRGVTAAWFNQIIDQEFRISGRFNDIETSMVFNKFEANDIDKKDDYLTSYQLISQIQEQTLRTRIHTFSNSPLSRDSQRIVRLCHSAIKSPYYYDINAIFHEHSKTVASKTKDGRSAIALVVDLIREAIDHNIVDINLTEDDGLKRFIVDSQQFTDKDVDITTYGEGVQRVFYIALAFAASRNGVVCIDEFETAIHYSLLIEFSKFIQILARKFNVQVFLTTHSKECVDAFLSNNYHSEDITGFRLTKDGDTLRKQVVKGERFKRLSQNINLDIRGERQQESMIGEVNREVGEVREKRDE